MLIIDTIRGEILAHTEMFTFRINLESEYRSCSSWERPIGVCAEFARFGQVVFVPAAPIYPVPHGAAWLVLRVRREELHVVAARFYLTKKILLAFSANNFEFLDKDFDLMPGDVLTLAKDNEKTRGLALPEALVQVEMIKWP